MHSAPAVSYPVGRSHFQALFLTFTVLLALATGVCWLASALWDWRQGLMAAALCLSVLFAWQAWRQTPQGTLVWDGDTWCFSGEQSSVVGAMSVSLDLQFVLLLRLTPLNGRALWLWGERKRHELLWLPLRRAVFSRRLDPLHQTSREGSPVKSEPS
jgi:hypothetical protein